MRNVRVRVWIYITVLAVCLVAFGVAVAWAQGVGNVQAASNQVILYEHINWGGYTMSFEWDKDVPDLTKWKVGSSSSTWNDRISSIKVGSGSKLILYEHTGYRGASITLLGTGSGGAGDFPDLRKFGWNDKASSFKVRLGNIN